MKDLNRKEMEIPKNVRQTSMTILIPSIGKRRCPTLRSARHATEYAVDFPGLSAVFVRFFSGHCQLQLFLVDDLNRSSPWRFFTLSTSQMYIKNWNEMNFSLLSSLMKVLFVEEIQLNQFSKDLKWIEMFDISIHLSNRPFFQTFHALEKRFSSIFAIGDCLISPHYRLGFGINAAFLRADVFMQFISTAHDDGLLLDDYEIAIHSLLQKQYSAQQLTILGEAYCNAIYYYDFNATDLLTAYSFSPSPHLHIPSSAIPSFCKYFNF